MSNPIFIEIDEDAFAPAFDIKPVPGPRPRMKTWISEAGPEATIDGLMSVIPYFRISPKRAREMLGVVEHAVAGWRKKGRAIGMTGVELDQFADAFEHPEREAARKVVVD
jgi:serine/threonine-protein kinase HipA